MRIAAYRTMQGGLSLVAVVGIGALAVLMADQRGLYDAVDLLLAPPASSQDPLVSPAYARSDVTVLPAALDLIARWLLAFAGAATVLVVRGLAGLLLVERVTGEAAPAADPAAAHKDARSAAPAPAAYEEARVQEAEALPALLLRRVAPA